MTDQTKHHSGKRHILPLVLACPALAMPPVLSLTQTALQKSDPNINPDHYEIARTDFDGDGKEDVLVQMNQKSGYQGSGGTTVFILKGTADGFQSLTFALTPPSIISSARQRPRMSIRWA